MRIDVDVLALRKTQAESMGVILCDFCGIPRVMHSGFDHAQGTCLVDTSGWTYRVFNASEPEASRQGTIDKAKAFLARIEQIDESIIWAGAGI